MCVYMLDTDISSYIMKRSHEAVLKRLRKIPVADVRDHKIRADVRR